MVAERNAYLAQIVARLILHTRLFRELTQADLMQFLSRTEQFAFREGESIFREGDDSRSMYIVLRGCIEVSHEDAQHFAEPISQFRAGECFGEMALVDTFPRSGTSVAKEPSILFAFTEEAITPSERLTATIYKNLARVIADRCKAVESSMAQYLHEDCFEADCFKYVVASTMYPVAPMDGQLLSQIRKAGRVQEVSAGRNVVWEGTSGRALYVVVEGELEVFRTDRSKRLKITQLAPGQCFGEIGFLSEDYGRVASVEALRNSKVLRIEAGDLKKSLILEAAVYLYLARKLSIRLRGLNRGYDQIVTSNCRSDCPLGLDDVQTSHHLVTMHANRMRPTPQSHLAPTEHL